MDKDKSTHLSGRHHSCRKYLRDNFGQEENLVRYSHDCFLCNIACKGNTVPREKNPKLRSDLLCDEANFFYTEHDSRWN